LRKQRAVKVLDNIPHDVLSDYTSQEVPGYKWPVNDTANEEIFISDKQEAFAGKVNNEDAQG